MTASASSYTPHLTPSGVFPVLMEVLRESVSSVGDAASYTSNEYFGSGNAPRKTNYPSDFAAYNSSTSIHPMDATFGENRFAVRKMLETLAEIQFLKDDWDLNGAAAVKEETVHAVNQLLEFWPVNLPAQDLMPLSDGSIAIEFYDSDGTALGAIDVTSLDDFSYSISVSNGKKISGSLDFRDSTQRQKFLRELKAMTKA
jgi:hypothetical protein